MSLVQLYSGEHFAETFDFLMIDSSRKAPACYVTDRGYMWIIAEYLYLNRYVRLAHLPRDKSFKTDEWSQICNKGFVIISIDNLLYKCLFPGYEYISNFAYEKLNETGDTSDTYLKLGLVAFIFLTGLNLLFGWVRFIAIKKKELRRIRGFIALLPVDLIVKVKGFRTFFSQIVFSHSK